MNVEDETRRRVVSHYRSHSEAYNEIWSNLDAVRSRFEAAECGEKTAYLKLSYVNAVISIRTSAEIQEEAMTRLMTGVDLESAMDRVNYYRQKRKYIRQSLEDETVWEEMTSCLKEGDIDIAHKTALDRLKYIGTVKAPFILANLGFTEKMCFDSNVVRVAGMNDYPSTTDVTEYEDLCRELRNEFPVLSKELDPFHLHWVIFDWQRNNAVETEGQTNQVTFHDAWFDAVLADPSKIKKVVEALL